MNPFAVAQERAWALRAQVLGERAIEPVEAEELIALAVRKLRFRVVRVAKDSPRLAKADAVLFRKTFHICVSKAEDPSQQAYLIGHEVGHLELHPEGMATHRVTTSGTDLAPPRSSGTQYVEAYGPRERSERQANVFSREFLLPRHVAVSLRKAGWSTLDMAKRLGLPLELVRLQLLDGMLLPKPSAEAPEVLKPLTQEQREAAHDTSRFVNVVAGPGAGKTRTLIGRLQHLIEGGCPPHRILVLTFSNKAAREIVDRLQTANVPDVQNVWSGTFHAFGLELIRKYHEYFDLLPNVQVMDKLAQLEIAGEKLPRLGLEHYSPYDDASSWLDDMFLNVINRCREELVDSAAYAAAVAALGSASTPQQRDTARIFTAYEQTLKDDRALDFSSLVEKPALALRDDPEAFTAMTRAFDHVLVDEYQDVNRATAILLAAFAQHAKSVWVVGDPRQAIYRFRGASLRNLTEFDKDFPDAEKRRLLKNWRTGPGLLQFINHVGQTGPLQDKEPFEPLTANEGRTSYAVEVATCADGASMHATLAKRILDSVGEGNRLTDHLVLARNNDVIAAASAQLDALGVPCIHFGGIFERPEVRDLLSLFLLLFERFPTALTRVAQLPLVAIPEADVRRIQSAVAQSKPLERLGWLRNPPSGLSSDGMAGLARLKAVVGQLKWSSEPWNAVCELLLDRPDELLRRGALSPTQAEVRDLAMWMVAYFCKTNDGHGGRMSLSRLLHRVRRRQRLKDVGPLRELPPEAQAIDAVRLMTIHGSKGLEAEHVHLLDAHDGHFKPYRVGFDSRVPDGLLGSNQDEMFEQGVEADNVLFVAVSRAEERLTLYEDRRWPHKTLEALQYYNGPVTSVTAQCSRAPLPASATSPSITTDFEQVLAYAGCPRRYYYREVLQLQASGDASDGARALSAVVDAAKRLCEKGQWSAQAQAALLGDAWSERRLEDPAINPALWMYAVRKLRQAVSLIGSTLAKPEPTLFPIGSHQLHVQLHCQIDFDPKSVGGVLVTFDALRNKSETRDLLIDLTATYSPHPNKRPIKVINVRAEKSRDTHPYSSGVLKQALDDMAAQRYPQRPDAVKCGSCAFLFICGC
ncbi:MAG: UvrD-helicase domain-containing protein [Proteobacteria bacterium]|nr:UvrD-helicase domain-containing protein [Pseudomonadota bacterium]